MKKQKRFILALLGALVLTMAGDVTTSAKAIGDGFIMETPTLDPNAAGGGNNNNNNGNNGEGSGGNNEGSEGSGSTTSADEPTEDEIDQAVSAVTAGSKVSQKQLADAGSKLSGLIGVFETIMAFFIILLSSWIPLSFIADITVAFIPFLDRWIGSGQGGSSGGPNGGSGGGKGFHIQLTSSHSLRGGSGGPNGGSGSGGIQFGEYFKARTLECVYVFVFLTLVATGGYSYLLNLIVKYLILIIFAIVNLVKSILDGFV